MNLRLPAVIMFVAGVVLMYAAVKNRDPRDVVLNALGRKSQYAELSGDYTAAGKAMKDATDKALQGETGMGPNPNMPGNSANPITFVSV